MRTIFIFLTICGTLAAAGGQTNSFPPQLLSFSAAKAQQVESLSRDLNVPVPAPVTALFKAAQAGDYAEVSNRMAVLIPEYEEACKFDAPPDWAPFWQPMTEVESAYAAFAAGGAKYPLALGRDIIASIPAGSIYFGGTDAGRMLVTALCVSQAEGKPFFTLTQNALSNGDYEDYVRRMYGSRIVLPGTNEVQTALDDYKTDLLRRWEHDHDFPTAPRQLKPGEDFVKKNGRVEISGQVSVMAVHDRLAKFILDQNPKQDFYLEESYPLESLYPCESPHRLILKVNHQPWAALPVADLDADHAFWTKQFGALLGNWLTPDTSISNVCAFARAVCGQKNGVRFRGDRQFVTNQFATGAYSKLRLSIAGLYDWRMTTYKVGTDDKARLKAEADYAFRQAYAMCPTSAEALYRLVSFLLTQNRFGDALLVAQTTQKLAPDNPEFQSLVTSLAEYEMQNRRPAH